MTTNRRFLREPSFLGNHRSELYIKWVMKEVEYLIPHRDPFLYVDKLVSFNSEVITGTKIFSDADPFLRGSFPDFNFVPGVILIEAMAQCGGAGIRKLGLASGVFAFANIESAEFYAGVEYETVFNMIIKNIKVGHRLIKQSGTGMVDNKPCLKATWTCIKVQ